MFINFGKNESIYALRLLRQLRDNGINAEIYPDSVKIRKQLDYANTRGIPFVAMAGENEMAENVVTLKNMNEGGQKEIAAGELLKELRRLGY